MSVEVQKEVLETSEDEIEREVPVEKYDYLYKVRE
jgi:hypothetical protein